MIPSDAEQLIVFTGLTSDEMLAKIKSEIKHWRGGPILPADAEFKIVDLRPERFEPDIEDTP